MDPKLQTSFIPKRPLNASPVRRGGVNFFSLIAVIIFLASIAAAGGVYAYGFVVKGQIELSKRNLAKAQEAFDPDFIAFITRLNTRINVSKEILHRHIATSSIFELFERFTIEKLTFDDFKFAIISNGDIEVSAHGYARDYDAIADQSEEFGKSKYIKDAIFSNLNLDERGNVTFSFRAFIDPLVVRYGNSMRSGNGEERQNTEEAEAVEAIFNAPAPEASTATSGATSTIQ